MTETAGGQAHWNPQNSRVETTRSFSNVGTEYSVQKDVELQKRVWSEPQPKTLNSLRESAKAGGDGPCVNYSDSWLIRLFFSFNSQTRFRSSKLGSREPQLSSPSLPSSPCLKCLHFKSDGNYLSFSLFCSFQTLYNLSTCKDLVRDCALLRHCRRRLRLQYHATTPAAVSERAC